MRTPSCARVKSGSRNRISPSSQVGRWLARWAELAPAPHPTVADLTERKLLDLCRTPVLLFMVAQTWKDIAGKRKVKRMEVYDTFIATTARSKLEYDQVHHPEVWRAGLLLREQLVARGILGDDAKVESAIRELLEQIAWLAHAHEQRTEAPFTSDVDATMRVASNAAHARR